MKSKMYAESRIAGKYFGDVLTQAQQALLSQELQWAYEMGQEGQINLTTEEWLKRANKGGAPEYFKTTNELEAYDENLPVHRVKQLEAINAELLAMLEKVRDCGCRLRRVDELEGEYVAVPHPETVAELEATIARMKQKPTRQQ